MIFSARHYSTLVQEYSQMFGHRVPEDVLESAAKAGKAPDLMEALFQATKFETPIQNWKSFEGK